MSKPFVLSIFVLSLVVFSQPLFAAPKINASLSENQISQDATVLLSIKVEWPQNEGTYSFGVPQPDFENLSLIRRGESQEFFSQDGQDWTRKTFELELKPLGAGKAEVRPFAVTYVDPATQQSQTFQVPAMPMTIQKSSKGHPLRIMIGGGAFLIGTAIILTVLLSRRKPKPIAAVPVLEEEKTAQRIRSIIDGGPRTRDNFLLMTADFRQFLSEHYKIGRAHATEDEIISLLKSKDLPHEEWQQIQNLLKRIQEAKYLPEQSAVDDFKHLPREILSFIDSKKALEPVSRD